MNKKHKLLVRKILSLNKLALGIVLAIVAVRTVSILRQAIGSSSPSSAAAAPTFLVEQPAPASQPTISDYAAIFEKNIFTAPFFSPEPNSFQALQSAEDLLGLRLVGTIAGSPDIARAIIKDLKTNLTGTYKIGDTVGGATVEQIERNCVTLVHDSRKNCLNLYANTSGSRSSTDRQAVHNELPIDAETPAPVETKTPVRFSKIETILKTAKIVPNTVDGKIEGLVIKDLGNSEIAAALGLKDGDIIQSVNGQKLTSAQKAFQVLKKARSQSKITVNLSRNGKPETLSFPLR